MAKRRRKKRHANLSKDVSTVIAGVVKEVREEMEAEMSKVASMSENVYRRELHATGLQPSSITGTKDLQSGKMKSRDSFNQSMFDITSGVDRVGNKLYARAGSRDSWVASFFNNDADHIEWGRSSGGLTKEDLGFDAKNFIDKALKVAKSEASAMIQRAFDRGLSKANQKTKYKYPTK